MDGCRGSRISGFSLIGTSPNARLLPTYSEKARRGEDITVDEFEIIKSFANNSVVGASKLLHFLFPTRNPIWDRRVARVFLSKPKILDSEVNKMARWVEYKSTLLTWLNNVEILDTVKKLRSLQPALTGVSDLRLMELVLFHRA
jgi:hypothetical protein